MIVLSFVFNQTLHAQITVTGWENNKRMFEIKDDIIRNWVTNEPLFEFRNNSFIDSKTGERLFALDKKKLLDAKTGSKLFEYKNGVVFDLRTGKNKYEIDHSTKIISDSGGKRLFEISQSYIMAENFFLILIAADLAK